jgi:hypothetical protein
MLIFVCACQQHAEHNNGAVNFPLFHLFYCLYVNAKKFKANKAEFFDFNGLSAWKHGCALLSWNLRKKIIPKWARTWTERRKKKNVKCNMVAGRQQQPSAKTARITSDMNANRNLY